MERRKILLGSGAALTTALAGCTGSDSSDDDESDDTESITDGETEIDEPDANGDGEPEDADGADPTGETDGDDIPGFDAAELDLETDAVTITEIERAGDRVEVVAASETADLEELYAELETLPDDHEDALVDHEAFVDEIETIEWVVDHDEKKVVSFTVEVAWLVAYHEGELSRAEFLAKVESTAE